MKVVFPVVEAHTFVKKNFVGGDASLDFINTVNGRDQIPRDWLDGYPRLLEWASKAALLPPNVIRVLEKCARAEPVAASKALERAKELREALFLVTTNIIAGRAPAAAEMALLNRYWHAGVAAHVLRYEKDGLLRSLWADGVNLDLIASLVAYRFVENVLTVPRDRLRLCDGSDCAWLFVDRSKAGLRRWCDMAVCGNAAKSRRFHARGQRDKRA